MACFGVQSRVVASKTVKRRKKSCLVIWWQTVCLTDRLLKHQWDDAVAKDEAGGVADTAGGDGEGDDAVAEEAADAVADDAGGDGEVDDAVEKEGAGGSRKII